MDDKDKRIAELEALLKAALERIAVLEAEVAALKKNSSNSSKPPSSDIVKPSKHLTGTPGKKKRKRGAQKGHKRNLRKPFDENQIDKIVEFSLEVCPTCGGKLALSDEPPKVHQQVELVDKPFDVTEYRQGYGRRLLKKIQEMFATIHRRDELSERTWQRQMQAHREAILKVAWGTIPSDKDAINIAERLWNWRDESFRFINEKIPPTNNLGEQTIRKVVIDRKVTQGTRSDWGNRWLERFWSVLSTCEQRGTNVMSFLKSCVESFLHGLAPPSLLGD